jgi:hypothetical protein
MQPAISSGGVVWRFCKVLSDPLPVYFGDIERDAGRVEPDATDIDCTRHELFTLAPVADDLLTPGTAR